MKNTTELSPSTFARKKREGKLPWTKLFAESVNMLMNSKISDRARALYLLIQPILGEHLGCLLDSNKMPHSPESLSRCLYGRGHIEIDLDNLVRNGVLEQKNGVVFCPFMVRDKGKNRDDLVTIQHAGTSRNINEHQCTSDDLVTIPLGKVENWSDPVEYSRVVLGSAPKTTTLTATEKKENREDPVPFSGLTETDLNTIRAEYPNNFDKVYEKFVQYHLKKGSQNVNLTLLRGWFKRERQEVGKIDSEANKKIDSEVYKEMEKKRIQSLPNVKVGYDEDDEKIYLIGKKQITGDMFNRFAMLPKMPILEAHRWLCEITKGEWNIKGEWNTIHFMDCFEGSVFFKDDDGEWAGMDYETPEEVAERLTEEKEAKEERREREQKRILEEERLELKRQEERKNQEERKRIEKEEQEKRSLEKLALANARLDAVRAKYNMDVPQEEAAPVVEAPVIDKPHQPTQVEINRAARLKREEEERQRIEEELLNYEPTDEEWEEMEVRCLEQCQEMKLLGHSFIRHQVSGVNYETSTDANPTF